VRRHLAHDHRSGADPAARPDGEGPDDAGAGPDDDIVGQGRVALLLLEARAAQGDAVEQRDVLPDLGRLADDHAHAVVDEQARPQLGGGVDLDARQETAHMGQEARGYEPAVAPEPVSGPVEPDGVDARVTEHHLERRVRGGVTFENRPNIASHSFEHTVSPSVTFSPGLGPSRAAGAHHAPPPGSPAPRPRPRGGAPPAARPRPPRPWPPARPRDPRASGRPPARSPRSRPRWWARTHRSESAPPPPVHP